MELPISYKRYLDQGRQLFTDSRQVIPGGVFLALHGHNFNGNQFAMDALEKGAAYAIVDQLISNDPRLILVGNTLQELQSIANINRKLNKAKIIAITGSNGKTTTKELSYSIFKRTSNCIATQGNFNNHIGLPLTLLRITEETEYAIVEMGANQPGDIHALCAIALPDIGLITNIGKAHLQGFGSIQGVIKTKMELFDFIIQNKGICVYNLFSEQIRSFYKKQEGRISIGLEEQNADYFGELKQSFPTIEMKFNNRKEEIALRSNLFGEYNYQNILFASTLASLCGVDSKNIQEGIASYVPGNMRSQILQFNGNTILLDAYNANPSSMKEVIEIFDKMSFNKKWVIVGEMAELGDYKESEHQNLAELILSKRFDQSIFIGKVYDAFVKSKDSLVFNEVGECRNWLESHWPDQTAILIKGSRSSYLEKLIR
jgi:UDP-N-acetylmuramoyl-tripeptide--D-alanyl-D-alanine ligase